MLIKQDRLDKEIFKANLVNDGVQKVQDLANAKKCPDIASDLWATTFKASPEYTDGESDLKKLLQDATSTKEFKALRQQTTLNELNSSIAMATFGKNFLENVPEQELEKAQKQQQRNNLANGLQGLDPKDPFAKAVQKQIAQLDKAIAKFPTMSEEQAQQVRVAVRQAAEEASEEALNLQAACAAWGTGVGQAAPIDKATALKLAKAIQTDKFKKFLDLIGRAVRAASAIQSKKLNQVPHELCGIELGDKPQRALPVEMSLLSRKNTKLEFYRKYNEKSLLCRKMRGNEKAKKGDIIVCLDESGSMSDCIDLAKAIAIACFSVAKKQKRGFALIRFSDKAIVESNLTIERVPELLEDFMNGGTDYDEAFKAILKIIAGNREKNADVLFISDGGCYDIEAAKRFQKAKTQQGFRCMSLGIGLDKNSLGSLPMFSDKVITTNSLTLEDGEEMFKFL